MSRRLIDFTLNRAGWGSGHALDLDVHRIEAARDPATLPNLLQVEASAALEEMLAWPGLSGCALQCQYALGPVGRDGPRTLMTAEAVGASRQADMVEIELVKGWPGEPYYWGNRPLWEEEVEAAIHGMPVGSELQVLSVPEARDVHDAARARIMKSRDDTAVLFIANLPEEAGILGGVVARLCDTGVLVRHSAEVYPLDGSSLAGAMYQRTDRQAPLVTRWLGGRGPRSQQAAERRAGIPWADAQRWTGSMA